MKTVYVETSIVSYLTAHPSGDLLTAAWQKSTLDWWEKRCIHFELYTSDIALEEAARGDSDAARKRLEVLHDIPVLAITEAVRNLSKSLIQEGALPQKALDDSLHIAIAAVRCAWNRLPDHLELSPY